MQNPGSLKKRLTNPKAWQAERAWARTSKDLHGGLVYGFGPGVRTFIKACYRKNSVTTDTASLSSSVPRRSSEVSPSQGPSSGLDYDSCFLTGGYTAERETMEQDPRTHARFASRSAFPSLMTHAVRRGAGRSNRMNPVRSISTTRKWASSEATSLTPNTWQGPLESISENIHHVDQGSLSGLSQPDSVFSFFNMYI